MEADVHARRFTNMAEQFVAETQYGDLTGTISLDGHESAPLAELAEFCGVPEGYFPIGIAVYGIPYPSINEGLFPIRVVAVRKDEAGDSLEAVTRYHEAHGVVPRYEFFARVDPAELASRFKRLQICALLPAFHQFNYEQRPTDSEVFDDDDE
jgi:hypothetical protein